VANADYMGVVSALMKVVPHAKPELTERCHDATGTLGALWERFGTMSGVSGGSWFASQMIYSKIFDDLLLASAKSPDTSDELWKKSYYYKILDPKTNTSKAGTKKGITKCLLKSLDAVKDLKAKAKAANKTDTSEVAGDTSLVEESAELHLRRGFLSAEGSADFPTDEHYWPWYKEMFGELIILIQAGGVTWHDLVVNLLKRGAGISPKMQLGTAAVPAWAKGKRYVQGATIVAPGPPSPEVQIKQVNKKPVISYTASGNGERRYVPGVFSVIVGAGTQQNAPQPFCAAFGCARP